VANEHGPGVRCPCGGIANPAARGDWYRCFCCGRRIDAIEVLEGTKGARHDALMAKVREMNDG
jgi:hypothetical protein